MLLTMFDGRTNLALQVAEEVKHYFPGNVYATVVPLRTMKAASRVFEIVRAMASEGNPNSVSDAGVGALAARSAVLGACLNVKINAAGLKDRAVADALIAEAEALAAEAVRLEAEVLQIVESKIG